MPNASMAKSDWGGMTAPQGTNDPRLNVPGLKHYPIEQVLFFHEKHLHNLMGAVGQLQLDASKNGAKASPKVDVEAIKESVKTELSTLLFMKEQYLFYRIMFKTGNIESRIVRSLRRSHPPPSQILPLMHWAFFWPFINYEYVFFLNYGRIII